MANHTPRNIVVDPFCFRQFREKDTSKGFTGTVFDVSIEVFERIVNERYNNESTLKDGYAPFCKHLFVTNDFTDATVNVLPITAENEGLLRTSYEARNERELPVLVRFFPKELLDLAALPKATYLDLILYSREQIRKENSAQGIDHDGEGSAQAEDAAAPWGIVSIKAQDTDAELPMNPITNMRNALGKEHGGSGVPLDREKYMEAVNYWKDRAIIT
jgi:Protein of unknown function (DUF3228)